jgi:hypothetical protein
MAGMKAKIVTGLFLLTLVVLINSCENKTTPLPATFACSQASDTIGLTYTNTMQAIINVQCGVSNPSCHAHHGASGYDYTTYAGIDANYLNGLLYQGLFGNSPRMPLTPQVGWDACTLAKFKAWMDAGCPQ